MGTKTLLSMQQFIKSAEKECENEDAELDAKRTKHDCVMALRQLFQDIESQLRDNVDQVPLSSNCQGGRVPPCTGVDSMWMLTMALTGSRLKGKSAKGRLRL